MNDRDLIGYGAAPPDPAWPGGARVALSFVLNYEEGGENTPLEGDPASEAFLHEVVGAPPTVGRRNLNTESMFEFGSRAGFWRVHRIFTTHDVPVTVFAVGQAVERNPEAARAMIARGGRSRATAGAGSTTARRESTRSARTCAVRSTRSSVCVGSARRLVHGSRDRGDPATRCRGRRLPLRLGLIRGRVAVLDGGRPRPPRHPTHSTRTTSSSCS